MMRGHYFPFVAAMLLLAIVLAAAWTLRGLFREAPGENENRVFDPAAAFAHLARHSDRLDRAYDVWTARREASGSNRDVTVGLGWSKAYSTEFTRATGTAKLDLVEGRIAVEVSGLDSAGDAEVWLVQNEPGAGRSAAPERGDRTIRVGRLADRGDRATLEAPLPADFGDFDVDQVVVTRGGAHPAESGVLFGSPTLFEQLRHDRRYGTTETSDEALRELVAEGAELFFNETFGGNGRTCGTCHPAENNFTIDPGFIATLDARDPLFVAEFIPELASNFERPELMRKVGLILENVDGFQDLERRFVMRGVPHTLALRTSLRPARDGADGSTVPPVDRVGWSGDGSPGSGSLREFANGAIRQHFTRTLGRVASVDFRFATERELDALEAFQLFLGRGEDPTDLEDLRFRSERVSRGREIFFNEDAEGGTVAAGKCNTCHANGGATVSFVPDGINFNFQSGVADLPDRPADLIDASGSPPDGGFGREPDGAGAFGNGTFNTPTVIEAADTGPFFHDNSVETIEGAVAFYNSEAFNASPAGRRLADPETGVAIRLEPTQVGAVAAFLRALNALENLRLAVEFADSSRTAHRAVAARTLLRLAAEETQDAVEVLECGRLHPASVRSLREARKSLELGARSGLRSERKARAEKALDALRRARGELVEG